MRREWNNESLQIIVGLLYLRRTGLCSLSRDYACYVY